MPDPEKDLPSIVVEFVSKRHRDRVRDYEEKRRDYLAAGVQEYWIIDRFRRIMTVYRRPPVEPAELVVKESDVYRTPLLPGFELPLARLLKVADDWNRGTKKARSDNNQGRAERGSTPGEHA
jgi:Uma2 family endonuclease